MMMFDERTGKHLTSVHKTHQIHDDVVVNLDSRHNGMSDITLNTVLEMVHKEKSADFHNILKQLQSLK